MSLMLEGKQVSKRFVLHGQGGTVLPVFDGIDLTLGQGECVALVGRSGSGKSTLMRMIYGNYLAPPGAIRVRHRETWVDVGAAPPRVMLDVRRRTMGHVSQFLRVIPRIAALDIVADPLVARGGDADGARERARAMLTRLSIPERLWSLPPSTFSGGEQQRINIARALIAEFPILLLDEPTASLDEANRDVVVGMIEAARDAGTAILGIFHDAGVRDRLATRALDLSDRRVRIDA